MRSRAIPIGLIVVLIALVAAGVWQTRRERARSDAVLVREPAHVMGTACLLAAVPGSADIAQADTGLQEAEAALRAVEARMSVPLADSEVSRLNAAPAGQEVALSRSTVEVLRFAKEAAAQTLGAFDVTCGPLIELWKRAGEHGRLPTEAELDDARAGSNWSLIQVSEGAAIKGSSGPRVDLGGIAKGYAIDRAVDALRDSGVVAGLVDVGGDLRCFGSPPNREGWPVDIRNPFGSGAIGMLVARDTGVCTSGNYARFSTIEGKRYSHIIDPRTGWPADAVPSVTVLAPTAMAADVWATALSVLGTDGLTLLPEDAEVLIVLGGPDDPRVVCTPMVIGMLEGPLPWPVEVCERPEG
jgi:thiamine biosynthesis lipoprotein